MSVSRKRALERGQAAIERPKGEMALTLFHGKTGLTLRYQGKVIARTSTSHVGKQIAPFIALALGLRLPKLGATATAKVSSGVLYRVLSISTLDLRQPEARQLLDYLLDEAASMRGFKSAQLD